MVCALAFRRKTYPACPTIFLEVSEKFLTMVTEQPGEATTLVPEAGAEHSGGRAKDIQVVPHGHGDKGTGS